MLRIIAGEWKGRRIRPPADERVRPTADRVREAWMSIVREWLPGARVLELFAGSGALGLEALSRGAASADFVELAPASLRALRENVEALGAGDRATIHRADAVRFVKGLDAGAYDVCFADPPYGLGLGAAVAERWLATPFSALLCVEHRRGEALPPGGEMRRYGDTAITFYDAAELSPDADPEAT